MRMVNKIRDSLQNGNKIIHDDNPWEGVSETGKKEGPWVLWNRPRALPIEDPEAVEEPLSRGWRKEAESDCFFVSLLDCPAR